MGQKVHPYGFRVGITRGWQSRWFAEKSRFGTLLVEDVKIRQFVTKRLKLAGIARSEIERTGDEVRILLHAARPGLVIGRKHAEVDRLRDEVQKLTGKKVVINIREVSNPDANAQLVAEAVSAQLAKRSSFRRAMRRAMESARHAGALGVKIICAGRLGGSEMSRTERYVDGSLPLHNLSADIDYGFTETETTYGKIGVKVWLYKGPIVKEKPQQQLTKEVGRVADAKTS